MPARGDEAKAITLRDGNGAGQRLLLPHSPRVADMATAVTQPTHRGHDTTKRTTRAGGGTRILAWRREEGEWVVLSARLEIEPPAALHALPLPGVAVAVAVAALLAQTPDNGGAQAGGVSPPFTVCTHSWFQVWGSVGRSGRRGVGGSERDEWQVWCPRRRFASLGPVL